MLIPLRQHEELRNTVMKAIDYANESAFPGSNSAGGIQSVEIGCRVLFALAGLGREATLRDISNAVGLASSKTHRYLASLARGGLVQQNPLNQKYDLGAACVMIGAIAMGRTDYLEQTRRAAELLRETLDLNVAVAAWSTKGPVLVNWLESARPISVIGRVGTTLSPLNSNAGRTFVAFMEPAERIRQLDAHFDPAAPPTDGGKGLSRKEFKNLLQDIRDRGMSRVAGDFSPGISALSAPIFDASGQVKVVLSLIDQEGHLDTAWDSMPARALMESTQAVSRRLGAVERHSDGRINFGALPELHVSERR